MSSILSRRGLRRGALLLCFGGPLLLSACGGETNPAETPSAAPTLAPAAPAAGDDDAAGAESAEQSRALAARAEQALRAERLVAPEADNAFELYLQAVEADPGNSLARTALDDLVTYAVLHIEQRAAAGDAEEVRRVLELIQRGAPQAPALPRLQRTLTTLDDNQQRLAAAAAAARQPVEPTPPPARANPEPSAAPIVSPTPVAPSAPAVVSAPTPPPDTAPEPQQSPASAQSSAATPRPLAQPAAPAAQAPEVVFQPPLRYPAQAERRRIEGFVELEFTIAADGSVSQVEVVRAEPPGMFEREAVGAMQRWRFAPPTAPMRARRVLEFKLAR